MDIQKLKGFAERLRAYLERQNLTLKHGQALDLIAAIPGLRNWPEVNAFPTRLAAAQWDDKSAGRLAGRITKQHAITLSPDELLQALQPGGANSALRVWPDGPVPGVYVTTSQEAIDAAIAKYEAEADGALLYAEEAGRSSDSAIDLGENGLFSRGMDRVPSGTLVVIGPLPLTQESWNDNKDRLNTAANLAHSSSLRIAVLVETPFLGNLHSDVDLLLRPDGEPLDTEPVDVLGVVSAAGDLQVVQPFVQQRQTRPEEQQFATEQRLPMALEDALKQAVVNRPFGLIVLGITPSEEPREKLMEAVLPLTTHAGPAARIQPTFRSGYGKDDTPMSRYFEGLPVFPSIESAYAHGYRRMVIESSHSASKAMAAHANDTCFLLTSYSNEVVGALIDAMPHRQDWPKALDAVIALLCVADIDAKKQIFEVCDAFIAGTHPGPSGSSFEDLATHLQAHRVVCWEEDLDALIDAKKVTAGQAKRALERRQDVAAYLASRTARA